MKRFIKSFYSHKEAYLSKSVTLFLLRILVSLAMINTHGIKKLIDFEGTIKYIPDPLGIGGELSALVAIIANVIAPIFIILGLGTRLAILPILCVTLIGFFIVHGNDSWAIRDVPLMYSLTYLTVFFLGPGKYSLDYQLFNSNNK